MAGETNTEQAGQAAAAPAEKQTNCIVCNKPIKRLTRYYHNGKFYCTRRCWKKSKEKKPEEEQK